MDPNYDLTRKFGDVTRLGIKSEICGSSGGHRPIGPGSKHTIDLLGGAGATLSRYGLV